MANTTLGVVTTSANEGAYVNFTKADDEIATSFTIDWGDGSTVESYQASATSTTTEYTHTYADAGSYTIEVEVTAGKLRFFREYGEYDSQSVSSNINNVSTGDGLTTIGPYAFYAWGYYDDPVSITFGSDLTLIDENAFYAAGGLSSIDIPPNVSMGTQAFQSISGIGDGDVGPIESITIGSGCTFGEYSTFDGARISSLTLYSGVTSIADTAFHWVEDLTEVAIPSTVTFIGANAFSGCESLETVTIRATTPPTLEDGYPFDGCTSLTTIYVPTESLSAYQSASGWSTGSSLFVGTDVGPDPTPPSPEPPGPEPEPIILTGDKYLNDVGTMTLIGLIKYSLATKQDTIQVEEMAEPSEDFVGKVFQYIGETTSTYTNGYFYRCVSDGQTIPTYSWEVVNVNPVATTTTAGLMSAADKAKLDAISYATTADIDAMFE